MLLRLEAFERQLLQLVPNLAHSKPVGDRGVDIESFLGDRDAPLFREMVERAHVVQAVGQLQQDDPDVIYHRQQHLAEVFGLAFFTG